MRCGIEAEDLIVDAVGENDFAGLAHNEVVEEMLAGIAGGIAAEEIGVWIEVHECRIAALLGRVGPDGGVARVEADSENGQKMIAVGGNEIGSVAVRSDFNYFSLGQTTEIENFASRIPGQALGDEIFFFGDESQASLGDDGKIAMHFFDEVGEFVRSVEAGKFRAARWVESFAEGDAFFQKFDCFPAFAKMLMRGGHGVESGGAVGKVWEKFFDGVDLGAGFGGVGWLGGSAASFVLLGEGRNGQCQSGEQDAEKAAVEMGNGGHGVIRRLNRSVR